MNNYLKKCSQIVKKKTLNESMSNIPSSNIALIFIKNEFHNFHNLVFKIDRILGAVYNSHGVSPCLS